MVGLKEDLERRLEFEIVLVHESGFENLTTSENFHEAFSKLLPLICLATQHHARASQVRQICCVSLPSSLDQETLSSGLRVVRPENLLKRIEPGAFPVLTCAVKEEEA